MRVLWLCNIMLPIVAEHLGIEASNKEGWLSGLSSVILEHKDKNDIELAVAFPVAREQDGYEEILSVGAARLHCYGFYEDTQHPEDYDSELEGRLLRITDSFQPEVIHCFGTEYPHTFAICKAYQEKKRILLGLQGLCSEIAEAYFADLPQSVQESVTLRDVLRHDTLKRQQEKFRLRGQMEVLALKLAGAVTGRTQWDERQVRKWNPDVKYYSMNETLRTNFYEGKWSREQCEPYSIFVSQGDYPLKGLHYMLWALPQLREKYPQVKLYVAGADLTRADSLIQRLKLSAYGRYLRRLIRENALQEQVCFLGRLDAEEMKKQYLKSSVFVCCSSLENSPNSLGEAMLLGVPCISAEVGGIASLFEGGRDGILYNGFGAASAEEIRQSLVDAVLTMWEDTDRMEGYCAYARAHARRTHDGEKNYQRLLEIYEDVVTASCHRGLNSYRK